MYSFLVLGIIPGTNLVITFEAWLVFIDLLLGSYLAYRVWQRHQGLMFGPLAIGNKTSLHASQLHLRAL